MKIRLMGDLPSSSDAEKGLGSATEPVTSIPGNEMTIPISNKGPITTKYKKRSQTTSKSLLSKLWRWTTQKSGAGLPIDTSPPPEGGFQAWTVVLMCHLMGVNTWGFLNAFGVLQPHYVAALSRSPSEVSWIGSLQAFFLFFVSTISGRLTDAGYFHQTILLGTVLQLFGIFAASFSTQYWHLLLCHGICIGLGGGLVFIPAMSLVATYFAKRRSLALSICACGNSVGGLLFAAILQNTIPSVGYTRAMRVCGFVMLAALVPANFMLKPRRIHRSTGPLVEWKAFTEPAYGFFSCGMFLSMVGMWIPVFYLGSFGRDVVGIESKDATSLILIINGVGVAGRVLPSILAPIYGPMNLIVPLSFISALILFCWAAVKYQQGVLVFDVFYGIFMATAQGMLPPSLGSLTHDLSKMGVRLGMVFSLLGFAVLIGNPLAGLLISANGGGYLYAQMYSAAALMLGTGLLGTARYMVTGWKLFVKV